MDYDLGGSGDYRIHLVSDNYNCQISTSSLSPNIISFNVIDPDLEVHVFMTLIKGNVTIKKTDYAEH